MRIVMLAGGIAAARFTAQLAATITALTPHEPVTVSLVVNTASDVTLHGLRICPDLDAAMFAMAAAVGADHQRRGSTIAAELAAYGTERSPVPLPDSDVATHILRSHLLDVGFRLTVVTATLANRWSLPATLLPMTDQRVETHVIVDDGSAGGAALQLHKWWASPQLGDPVAFLPLGSQTASPTPEVLDALDLADLVLLAPGCPVTGIGPMLTVGGLRAAVRAAPCPVLGISPAIGRCLTSDVSPTVLGTASISPNAAGIGRYYRARHDGGLLDGWLVDATDSHVGIEGVEVRRAPLGHVADEVAVLTATSQVARIALGLAAGSQR